MSMNKNYYENKFEIEIDQEWLHDILTSYGLKFMFCGNVFILKK